ncbi:MAG: methyl-accepting chemotaxis protein [Bdellovibrio sp.]
MKLVTKVIGIVALSAAIASLSATQIAWREIQEQGERDLVVKSRAILDQLEGTRDFVAEQGGLIEYIDGMVAKHPDGQLSDEVKMNILKRVPIFSSIKVGHDQAEKSGYKFRVFSNEPRRKENLATSEEMEIFNRFEKDHDLKEWVQTTDAAVMVYRPVRLSEKQGCLVCHGNPKQSPFQNGKDILGYPMENWVDGKLHGVFAITSDMAATHAAGRASVIDIIIYALGGLVVSILLAWLVLRKPMRQLMEAIQSIKNSSSLLASTSQEISGASQNLSGSSTQAAAALEETSASIEELTGMVKQNTASADSGKSISNNAMVAAREGEKQIATLIESIKTVSETAQKVEMITGVIDDIAFQTNLLALNASVEAARAGEQGKGFSVVAEAVRNLAQKSAVSAKEISELISSSVSQANQSYDYAVKSGDVLKVIVQETEKVSTLNSEIAHASSEQSRGIQQIARAIHELDKVTQSNAGSSEETAAASVELSNQSHSLDELVQTVESAINGGKKAS